MVISLLKYFVIEFVKEYFSKCKCGCGSVWLFLFYILQQDET